MHLIEIRIYEIFPRQTLLPRNLPNRGAEILSGRQGTCEKYFIDSNLWYITID